ncbi:MAG: hypothetical protein LUD82_04355, partial [Clostridiales bacterium]|nr:hypothetical protein [Clostridiales bacterium]
MAIIPLLKGAIVDAGWQVLQRGTTILRNFPVLLLLLIFNHCPGKRPANYDRKKGIAYSEIMLP